MDTAAPEIRMLQIVGWLVTQKFLDVLADERRPEFSCLEAVPTAPERADARCGLRGDQRLADLRRDVGQAPTTSTGSPASLRTNC
jgi:hypothetical protein